MVVCLFDDCVCDVVSSVFIYLAGLKKDCVLIKGMSSFLLYLFRGILLYTVQPPIKDALHVYQRHNTRTSKKKACFLAPYDDFPIYTFSVFGWSQVVLKREVPLYLTYTMVIPDCV